MKMCKIFILLLLIFMLTLYEAKAQSLSTKIARIEIDGKEVKKSYKVFFLSKGNWIESEKTSTGFAIPSELKTEEYLTVLITFEKYKLKFSEIRISKFNVDWIVGIDKKPFSEEFVTNEEAKIIKRVYYIKFEGRGLVSLIVVKEKKTK